jgi:hypothetical protein
MGIVSRGFRGRRRPSAELPPGQYLVEDFPVLSAGPTPSIDCWTRTSRASGRASGITTTAIRGRSSGSGATDPWPGRS